MSSDQTDRFDAIVIGAGPNGLTCANYLMKAGRKVLVLEKRFEIGGNLITEDFAGARYDLHASLIPLSSEEMLPYSELGLADQGFSLVSPRSVAIHTPKSKTLVVSRDSNRNLKVLAGNLSPRDSESIAKLSSELKAFHKDFLLPWLYHPPSDSAAARFEVAGLSPIQILQEHYNFESDELKALLLFLGCLWGIRPKENNSGLPFLIFLDGMLSASIVRGGAYMLAYALYKPLIAGGCQVWEGRTVSKILAEQGRASGVVLDDGRKIYSDLVVSTVDIPTTFASMLGEGRATESMLNAARSWEWEPWTIFQAHWTVKGAVSLKNSAGQDALLNVVGYNNADDVVKHAERVSQGETMDAGCFILPSLFDSSLSPSGSQVVKFVTIAPFALAKGDWENAKESYAKKCFSLLSELASDKLSDDSVTWNYLYPPPYIQMKLANCVKGSINGGAYIRSQFGSDRPDKDCSSYKTPVKGLYVCGAGVHPGGLVTLAGGYNCAAEIAQDLGSKTPEKPIAV